MHYYVTAAYGDVSDEPQVYETDVEADSVEAAVRAAQLQAIEDNGMMGVWTLEDPPLVDVYARPAEPEVTARFRSLDVSEPQLATLTALAGLTNGYWVELAGASVRYGCGRTSVLVDRKGAVTAEVI